MVWIQGTGIKNLSYKQFLSKNLQVLLYYPISTWSYNT